MASLEASNVSLDQCRVPRIWKLLPDVVALALKTQAFWQTRRLPWASSRRCQDLGMFLLPARLKVMPTRLLHTKATLAGLSITAACGDGGLSPH